ncbi:hypothetical protein M885DRAFT_532768 [Pelagophyceae sp. CCMP2097]|nr:hypothetical protein M885DRAFT_532768 [Pelagophyceae sp. CCMP2097]|mmetsp:Transcript_29395/g.101632  ORF Transcript_29395/g.101632 Transcript_29395/m.101632 type:complete len:272 (-) Transcript_29395:126-941(-)
MGANYDGAMHGGGMEPMPIIYVQVALATVVLTALYFGLAKLFGAKHRLVKTEAAGAAGCRLDVRTVLDLSAYRPGRHFVLSQAGERPRKYTPVLVDVHTLRFAVKTYPNRDGELTTSSYLASRRQGARLAMSGPVGTNFYERRTLVTRKRTFDLDTEKVAFFSAGSGATPTVAVAVAYVDTGRAPNTLRYVHCDRSAPEVIVQPELAWLAQQPGVDVKHHWTSESGRVTQGYVGILLETWGTTLVLVCGPHGFCESVKAACDARATACVVF